MSYHIKGGPKVGIQYIVYRKNNYYISTLAHPVYIYIYIYILSVQPRISHLNHRNLHWSLSQTTHIKFTHGTLCLNSILILSKRSSWYNCNAQNVHPGIFRFECVGQRDVAHCFIWTSSVTLPNHWVVSQSMIALFHIFHNHHSPLSQHFNITYAHFMSLKLS